MLGDNLPLLGRSPRLRPRRHLAVEHANVTTVSQQRQQRLVDVVVVVVGAWPSHDCHQPDEPALRVTVPHCFNDDDGCGDGFRLLDQLFGRRWCRLRPNQPLPIQFATTPHQQVVRLAQTDRRVKPALLSNENDRREQLPHTQEFVDPVPATPDPATPHETSRARRPRSCYGCCHPIWDTRQRTPSAVSWPEATPTTALSQAYRGSPVSKNGAAQIE